MELVKVGLIGMIAATLVWVVLYQEGGRGSEVMGAKSVITQKTKAISADLSTLNTRTDIWKNAYNAFTYSPVAGFGAGSFEYAYRKYFDGNSYTGVAHSTLVKIAVELGIIGLICFIFYLAGTGFVSKSLLKESRYLFLFLSFCAGFLFSLVDFSFDVKAHMLTFYQLSSTFFFPVSNSFKSSKNKGIKTLRLGTFCTLTVCLLVNLVFTTRVNEFRTSIQNGDLLMENGLPVNALYPYRDATETMPLSNEGYTRALSALLEIYLSETRQGTRDSMLKEMTEYVSVLKGRGDKDSEVHFVLGKTYAAMQDHEKAEEHFRLALNYYPSSGHYVYEIANYYANNANNKKAMEVIRSFDPFIEKHRGPHNPRGIFVYKIRDLESDLFFKNRDTIQAFKIAYKNDEDAKHNVYLMTSAKARSFTRVDQFRIYLTKKADMYRAELPGGGHLQ
jgi:tetratricopeptide (TPR) repeat protein